MAAAVDIDGFYARRVLVACTSEVLLVLAHDLRGGRPSSWPCWPPGATPWCPPGTLISCGHAAIAEEHMPGERS